jgi:ABC-type glutathione transport system ATPase component
MTATLTPTRDRPTRLPSFFDSPAPAARVYEAVKVYGRGENEVRALDGVTVEFAARRFTAIMGPSGSGKSTLIHSVAGLNTQRAQICRSRASAICTAGVAGSPSAVRALCVPMTVGAGWT